MEKFLPKWVQLNKICKWVRLNKVCKREKFQSCTIVGTAKQNLYEKKRCKVIPNWVQLNKICKGQKLQSGYG